MIFIRHKASDWNFEEDMEIDTIEELIDYINQLECQEIVIWSRVGERPEIKEYDHYIE